jgi:ABC-type dipeptide/oligopeptide/nickel transport system permease component
MLSTTPARRPVLNFIARRLLLAIPVLLGVSILVFLVLYLLPGDPAEILLFGSSPTPEQVEQLRQQLGLDQPLPTQFVHFLGRVLHGDLGQSYVTSQTVASEIWSNAGPTFVLAFAAIGVGLVIGVPVGIVSGVRPGSWWDRIGTAFVVLGTAVPFFWLAIVLILIFAVDLGWLPSLGTGPPQALVLPAVALGWNLAAVITRLLRNSLVDIYLQPYIRVARAKGLSGRAILVHHALKNALIPVVTILGLQFGNLVAGAVVIEVIFGRNGIGSYLVQAITAKDIPAVQGVVLFVAVLYIIVNLLVELVYGFLDPRIRRGWATA